MAKRELADVLWEAANRHLRLNASNIHPDNYWTLEFAATEGGWWGAQEERFFDDLIAGDRLIAERTPSGEERQFLRYMALLFAVHVAEDEGIEVEVA